MVNLLFGEGVLQAPLPILETDFLIVQYADDTQLIMQACPLQLLALKQLLADFAQATGLCVNYSKTSMMSINSTIRTFSSWQTHLWLCYRSPLGTTRPTPHSAGSVPQTPTVDQVERRLNASARFLGYVAA
jgi:hypothetical protein